MESSHIKHSGVDVDHVYRRSGLSGLEEVQPDGLDVPESQCPIPSGSMEVRSAEQELVQLDANVRAIVVDQRNEGEEERLSNVREARDEPSSLRAGLCCSTGCVRGRSELSRLR